MINYSNHTNSNHHLQLKQKTHRKHSSKSCCTGKVQQFPLFVIPLTTNITKTSMPVPPTKLQSPQRVSGNAQPKVWAFGVRWYSQNHKSTPPYLNNLSSLQFILKTHNICKKSTLQWENPTIATIGHPSHHQHHKH